MYVIAKATYNICFFILIFFSPISAFFAESWYLLARFYQLLACISKYKSQINVFEPCVVSKIADSKLLLLTSFFGLF